MRYKYVLEENECVFYDYAPKVFENIRLQSKISNSELTHSFVSLPLP